MKKYLRLMAAALALGLFVACQAPLAPNPAATPPAVSRGVVDPAGKAFIGDGYNIVDNSLVGNAFQGFDSMKVLKSQGSTISVEYIDDYKKLDNYISFDYSSGGSSPWGSVSLTGHADNKLVVSSSSKIFAITVKKEACDFYVDNPVLKENAPLLFVSDKERFKATYGDVYKGQVTIGAELTIFIQLEGVDFSNITNLQLKSDYKSAFGALAASGSYDLKLQNELVHNTKRISILATSIGAYTPAIPTTFDNPSEVFRCVNDFINHYNNTADLTQFGVLSFKYNKYENLFDDDSLDRFLYYRAWKELENEIRFIQGDTLDPVLFEQCTQALSVIRVEKQKCISNDPAAGLPAPGLYQEIKRAWFLDSKQKLYELEPVTNGPYLWYVVSSDKRLIDDVQEIKTKTSLTQIRVKTAYNLPISRFPITSDSLPIYQSILPGNGGSLLLTSDQTVYNSSILNYRYVPFIGKKILGYVMPEDYNNPANASLLPLVNMAIPLPPPEEYVTGLYITTSRSSLPPAGYVKIPSDLNKGSGGNYIYLCYRKDKVNTPIRDIQVLISQRIPNLGYDQVPGDIGSPIDLNKGAGGAYIYLYSSTQVQNSVGTVFEPIKEVQIMYGTGAAPVGWKKIPVDLNKGAGGAYIYVIYRN